MTAEPRTPRPEHRRLHQAGDLAREDFARTYARVHFVGVGGTGMSGIAEVLCTLGYEVSGSDTSDNAATRRLAKLGATVHRGHAAANVLGADCVVVSSAIRQDNPELLEAKAQRIPVVPRAEMLAELMRFRRGIAVAGTHGKTTTTSLLASVLGEGGLDPTFVIGGQLLAAGANARLGGSQWLVAEADESDGSFLRLNPLVAIVTNIDADHLENYGGDFARVQAAFAEFLHRLPFYGLAVLCIDDPEVATLAANTSRHVTTYGFDPTADCRAEEVTQTGARMRFTLCLPDGTRCKVTLALPGRHNVQNALAAAAVAWQLGVEPATIARALEGFAGIGRRFNLLARAPLARGGMVTVVDDYGHHPKELAAVFEAARGGWPEKRLVVAFQPHRYSRTRDLFDEFAAVLSTVDALVLTEVYAAGEAPIVGADAKALARAIRARGRIDPVVVGSAAELATVLPDVLVDEDLLLMMGAGDIGQAAQQVARDGFGEGGRMTGMALPPQRTTRAADFGRVAVLMGGTSSEREVSLDSGRNVLDALRARGVAADAVDGIPALVDAIRGGRVDRVFNILHGNRGGGEDGVLQGLLDALQVPYTGSGVLGSALSMDKIRTKQVWLSLGLPTPRYLRISAGDDIHAAARSFGLPAILKPACEGSSVGITRLFDEGDIESAVALAARYTRVEGGGDLLMEQLVEGDELTVGILAAGDGHVALPSIRIVPKGAWYDYDAKYVADDTQYLCPGMDGAEEDALRALCLAAFDAAGCSGWGRVDVMRDGAGGGLFLLEVNTAPGMTSHSLVPKAAREAGVDFEGLCWRILETSLGTVQGASR